MRVLGAFAVAIAVAGLFFAFPLAFIALIVGAVAFLFLMG
jgi:hypothetical protein